MAGTIIADFIRTDANRLSLNVGNTVIASINSSGIISSTGNVLIPASGAFDANNVTTGTLGKARLPSGSVLQVVQTVKTDTFSSSSSSFTDITGMSVTITPTSATSRIMIMYNMNTSIINGGYRFDTRLVRNGSVIAVGDLSGNRLQSTTMAYSSSSAGEYPVFVQSMTFLDSPATTSSLTYKLQGVGWVTSTGTFYVNLSAAENNTSNFSRGISTITALEIAG